MNAGANGFIGKRLIAQLRSQPGCEINALSRSNVEGVCTYQCDLISSDIPEEPLKGLDTIFHLAG